MAFLSIASFRAVWMAVLSSSVQVLIVKVGVLHLIETSVDAGLFEMVVVQVVMVVVMVEQDCCETGWRWVFYTCILGYGINCLWDKAWLWDIRFCWYNYPFHQMDNDIWWYYMLELSFYWSLSISQFFDVKRKDFWEMLIHHITTISLIMFSWTAHFTRIGTLVMILHDCADHLLELAKLFRYASYRKTCDAVFVVFSVVWVITRCGLYPSWILYSTLYDVGWILEFFSAYYIFNSLLVTLQLLHILWTYFLFKAIHKALIKGGVDDQRSDSEPSEDENENELKKEN